jgi:hypothetical protein
LAATFTIGEPLLPQKTVREVGISWLQGLGVTFLRRAAMKQKAELLENSADWPAQFDRLN